MDAISTPMVAAALEALLEENAGISKGGNISV
jgi:hypothetical protein